MNEQLKRIRSKDFTSIDEKLFEDLSRAENLTSTLTHLSDFQKFLMEQISSLNNPSSQSKSSLIAKSIAKNFDDLKESLVKCSRLQAQPDIGLVNNLKEQISSLKKEIKQMKESVKLQVKEAVLKNNEIAQKSIEAVISKFEAEKRKREDLSKRCEALQRQKQQLRRQNEKLKQKASENTGHGPNLLIQQTRQQIIHRIEQDHRPSLMQVAIFDRVNSNVLSKEQGWKITRNKIALGVHEGNAESMEKRSNSLKRQTSNHELPRKTHLNCMMDKENENMIFKSKGVTFQEIKRGKSKQKIKLFSMI